MKVIKKERLQTWKERKKERKKETEATNRDIKNDRLQENR